ncbi:MAG: hypothetical protein ACRDGS_05330 [Chloroflexota bacterium]
MIECIALLTQQTIAQAIVDAGGDYLMIVKANQPALHAASADAIADPALLAGPAPRPRPTSAVMAGRNGAI